MAPCTRCGKASPESAKFCADCGQALAQVQITGRFRPANGSAAVDDKRGPVIPWAQQPDRAFERLSYFGVMSLIPLFLFIYIPLVMAASAVPADMDFFFTAMRLAIVLCWLGYLAFMFYNLPGNRALNTIHALLMSAGTIYAFVHADALFWYGPYVYASSAVLAWLGTAEAFRHQHKSWLLSIE
jgi:hypothetical protein